MKVVRPSIQLPAKCVGDVIFLSPELLVEKILGDRARVAALYFLFPRYTPIKAHLKLFWYPIPIIFS